MLQKLTNAGISEDLAKQILNGKGFYEANKTEVIITTGGKVTVMLEGNLADAVLDYWKQNETPQDDIFTDYSQDYIDSLAAEEWYQ